MAGQTLILTGQRSRRIGHELIAAAPDFAVLEIKPPRRSDDQNAKMWAMLSDISRAKPDGRKAVPEVWKSLFCHACGHAVQFELGLNGQPFPTGFKTSRMSIGQMSDLIEFIQAWGDEKGVRWTNETEANGE